MTMTMTMTKSIPRKFMVMMMMAVCTSILTPSPNLHQVEAMRSDSSSGSGGGDPKPYLHKIRYYLHLEKPEYVVSANSGKTSDMKSYSTDVFDLPMTRDISPSSESLGVVRGLSVIVDGDSSPSVSGHRLEELLNTILYDDGFYAGTIVQHGVYDLSLVYGDPDAKKEIKERGVVSRNRVPGGSGVEMAVVGGTGDFRCANGYSRVSLASPPPQTILEWEVFLYYPCHE